LEFVTGISFTRGMGNEKRRLEEVGEHLNIRGFEATSLLVVHSFLRYVLAGSILPCDASGEYGDC
jgi:hypothetical protein